MNVKMAMELAEDDDIEVKTVVANDDVASASKEDRAKRRGVAGEILMWKVGGAKANQGATLDEVIAAAQKAIDNTSSVGVGLSHARFRQTANRISLSKTGRWNSASAIMASRNQSGKIRNRCRNGTGNDPSGH